MSCVIGIDMGAVFFKGVLLAERQSPVYHAEKSGINYRDTAIRVRDMLLEKVKLDLKDCRSLVATGCGMSCIDFANDRMNEIVCLARFTASDHARRCVILDLGGRSCRAGEMDENGKMISVSFSEKCASGSGMVLESAARVLNVPFEELGALAEGADAPTEFTSSCAVFSESEIITAIARGSTPRNISAGVHNAVAKKIMAMLGRYNIADHVVIATGGAALDIKLIDMVSAFTNVAIRVPDYPQHAIAMGAALIAQTL